MNVLLAASLILITLDTTRQDHITPELAPHLSGGPALRFSYAVSAATHTLPAHYSILTGLMPTGPVNYRRDIDRDTWADLFESPAAAVSAEFLRAFEGEFEVFDAPRSIRSAARTTDAALELLEHDFLWVHYWSPHEYNGDWSAYRDLVKEMDTEVGRLLAHVPEDIWVLILSDHGEYQSGGHRNILHEDVTRIHFQIRGPGIDGDHDPLVSQVNVRSIAESIVRGDVEIPTQRIAVTEGGKMMRVWSEMGFLGDFRAKPHTPIMDEETVDLLRALGYVE